eukprot:m51a1_g14433 hypothetical protein (276) ;mRNA; r:529864-530861
MGDIVAIKKADGSVVESATPANAGRVHEMFGGTGALVSPQGRRLCEVHALTPGVTYTYAPRPLVSAQGPGDSERNSALPSETPPEFAKAMTALWATGIVMLHGPHMAAKASLVQSLMRAWQRKREAGERCRLAVYTTLSALEATSELTPAALWHELGRQVHLALVRADPSYSGAWKGSTQLDLRELLHLAPFKLLMVVDEMDRIAMAADKAPLSGLLTFIREERNQPAEVRTNIICVGTLAYAEIVDLAPQPTASPFLAMSSVLVRPMLQGTSLS